VIRLIHTLRERERARKERERERASERECERESSWAEREQPSTVTTVPAPHPLGGVRSLGHLSFGVTPLLGARSPACCSEHYTHARRLALWHAWRVQGGTDILTVRPNTAPEGEFIHN